MNMTRKMMNRRMCIAIAVCGAIALTGCGMREKLPDTYGLHAVDGGTITALKKEGEAPSFSAKVEFILFDKMVAQASSGGVQIRAIPLMPKREPERGKPENRGDADQEFLATVGDIQRATNEIATGVPSNAKPVETATKPVKGNAEMMRIVTSAPLEPGLYQIENWAQFFVERDALTKKHMDAAAAALEEGRWQDAADNVSAAATAGRGNSTVKEFVTAMPRQMLDAARGALKAGKHESAATGARFASSLGKTDKTLVSDAAKVLTEALFDVRSDGTVIDRGTSLVWAQEAADPRDWKAANEFVSSLTVGGEKDWRLPSHAESRALYEKLAVFAKGEDHRGGPFHWGESKEIHEHDYWTAAGGFMSFESGRGKVGGFGGFSKYELGGKHRILAVRQEKYAADARIDGIPALWWAARCGSAAIARKLLDAGAEPNAAVQNEPILFTAAENGHADIVEALLNKGAKTEVVNEHNATPLAAAVLAGHVDAARVLLKNGANPKVTVHVSGRSNVPVVFAAIESKKTEMLEAFLDAGIAPETRDTDENTLLMKAVSWRQTDMVRLLIKRGANVNVKTPRGETLLRSLGGGSSEIKALLMQAGAQEVR